MTNRSFCFFACLAVVYSARIKHDLDDDDHSGIEEISRLETGEAEHPSIYLNVVVSGVADSKVANLPGSATKGFVSGMSQKKVGRGVIATQVAREMPERVPQSLAELGIEAEAKQVFLRGAFTVVRLTILKANLTKLLTSRGEEARAKRASTILGWLHSVSRWFGYEEELDDAVTGAVNRKVAAQMCERLSEQLPPKLAEERGVDVNVKAVLEVDEAKYFFEFLENLEPEREMRSIAEKYGGKIATKAQKRKERKQGAQEEPYSEERTSTNPKSKFNDVFNKWKNHR